MSSLRIKKKRATCAGKIYLGYVFAMHAHHATRMNYSFNIANGGESREHARDTKQPSNTFLSRIYFFSTFLVFFSFLFFFLNGNACLPVHLFAEATELQIRAAEVQSVEKLKLRRANVLYAHSQTISRTLSTLLCMQLLLYARHYSHR
ncbi:hypothetical protein PUN28_015821 [Cardiocondyla obscurior]|uniref:Transmembrane protein n=1 Tax=Cardiocondyla obscurior TaxID=286306 RepID=A0AAW2ET30_9HYME